jgi:hypothetical protein
VNVSQHTCESDVENSEKPIPWARIARATDTIIEGIGNRFDLGDGVIVYKVPPGVIRVDINLRRVR